MSIFKRLNWGSEGVDTDKLNDMVGNDNYLFEHSIAGFYDAFGVTRDTGLSIRCGYLKIINTSSHITGGQVIFTRPFLPGAKPVVVTGLAIDSAYNIWSGINNLDGTAIPDHRGFLIHLEQNDVGGAASRFAGTQFLAYIAIAPSG